MKSREMLALAIFLAMANGAMAAPTLLLEYKCDEGSGASTSDSAANPANGTLTGGTTYTNNTPSGFGYAIANDGTNASYVTAGDASKLDGLSNFTLSTWINIQSVSASDRVMSKRGASGSFFDLYISSVDASGFYLTLAIYDGTGSGDSRTSGYIRGGMNDWIFIAATRSDTNQIAFYSGSATAAVSAKGTGTLSIAQDATLPNNTAAFMVGNSETNTTRAPAALFDDVRVYDGVADQSFLDGIRLENVPEPATAALILLPALAALSRRK